MSGESCAGASRLARRRGDEDLARGSTGMLDDDTPPELMGLRVVPLDSLSRFGRRSGPFTDFCPRYLPAEHCWTYSMVWLDGATVTHEPISERLLL
jgi:hypothetical protein